MSQGEAVIVLKLAIRFVKKITSTAFVYADCSLCSDTLKNSSEQKEPSVYMTTRLCIYHYLAILPIIALEKRLF
ncbi:hypothetical protein CHL76_13580 [Marinococcus halophilus]|uniref:Uncharacterized protein n=1 Tax=Marinococcus halophilus TaxID=1371 RepID=A0A510Y972_MARHA|nr:hypothetical protein CHL76_13580 [Marinococcus halophilus]GEK59713.1 hypothetical protein MHA01_26180 [Marinococcus halophilus]